MRGGSLMLLAVLVMGCGSQTPTEAERPPPQHASTDFDRLSQIISGIKAGEMLLYEGLPSQFWEPDAREKELKEKQTIEIRDYPLYEEPLKLEEADSAKLTSLFAATGSFQKLSTNKKCSGFHVDYCVEWKTDAGTTSALICLECGEVEIFSPQGELYCDFSDQAAKQIRTLLRFYSNNRPVVDTGA